MRYNEFTLLPIMAFKPLLKRMTLEGGKSDAPDTPDYTAAANATAQGNLEAARAAAAANRVNQYTPTGSLVYSHNVPQTLDTAAYNAAMKQYTEALNAYNSPQATTNGGGLMGYLGAGNSTTANRVAPISPNQSDFMTSNPDEGWSSTQTLSPDEQAKLDKNNKLSLGLLDTAQKGLSGVDAMLTKGFDFNALPKAAVDAGQTAQDAIMARLNPTYAQNEEALRTRLMNQGVRAGSQAWDNEFRNFNNAKNDAYSQAALQGIDVAQQARQQALQEQEFGRTEGLNMVNALRTGSQVNAPTFTNTPQQATTAGADLLGATQSQYNSALGANNASNAASASTTNGLMAAGTTAAMFF